MSNDYYAPWTDQYARWTHTPFAKWVIDEGLKVVQAPGVFDLSAIELGPWDRTGCQAVLLDLTSDPEFLDSTSDPAEKMYLFGQSTTRFVTEIPPGGTYKAEHHMYDEIFYVLKGRGATSVWYEGGPKQTFEWQEDSVFSIPLNAWHEIYNASGDEPARLFAATTLPNAINSYASLEFVFDCPMTFTDRFDPNDETYFSGKGNKLEHRYLETNFLPNALTTDLDRWEARGPGGNMMISMAYGQLICHMSEFPPMSYKKGHNGRVVRSPTRAGAITAYMMMSGEGYDLQWEEGVTPGPGGPAGKRIDYRRHSILTNGAGYHQHFNISDEPIRYMVLRHGNPRFSGSVGARSEAAETSNIEYKNEDPAVRELFEGELRKRGLESAMPPSSY